MTSLIGILGNWIAVLVLATTCVPGAMEPLELATACSCCCGQGEEAPICSCRLPDDAASASATAACPCVMAPRVPAPPQPISRSNQRSLESVYSPSACCWANLWSLRPPAEPTPGVFLVRAPAAGLSLVFELRVIRC